MDDAVLLHPPLVVGQPKGCAKFSADPPEMRPVLDVSTNGGTVVPIGSIQNWRHRQEIDSELSASSAPCMRSGAARERVNPKLEAPMKASMGMVQIWFIFQHCACWLESQGGMPKTGHPPEGLAGWPWVLCGSGLLRGNYGVKSACCRHCTSAVVIGRAAPPSEGGCSWYSSSSD